VQLVTNKKHQVIEVIVGFSGQVNSTQAQNTAEYRLATADKKGSYTAKNAKVVKLRSAVYNTMSHTVTLTPKKPFALKKPVQLKVRGSVRSGLMDDLGRAIDGNRDGQAGGDAIAVLKRSGSAVGAIIRGPLFVVRRSAIDFAQTR